MTTFLLTVTVFDDRAVLAWSTLHEGALSPIQHVGRASVATWMDTMGSMLPTDTIRIHVTDRRSTLKEVLARLQAS